MRPSMTSDEPGTPAPLGATVSGRCVNFSIYSRHAESVELVLCTGKRGTDVGRTINKDASGQPLTPPTSNYRAPAPSAPG